MTGDNVQASERECATDRRPDRQLGAGPYLAVKVTKVRPRHVERVWGDDSDIFWARIISSGSVHRSERLKRTRDGADDGL